MKNWKSLQLWHDFPNGWDLLERGRRSSFWRERGLQVATIPTIADCLLATKAKCPAAKTSKVLTKPIFSSSWTGTSSITFPSPFELRKLCDGIRPEENQQKWWAYPGSPVLVLFSQLLDRCKWQEGAFWGPKEWWTVDGKEEPEFPNDCAQQALPHQHQTEVSNAFTVLSL